MRASELLNAMKRFHPLSTFCLSAIGVLIIALGAHAQSDDLVRRTKRDYEKRHPGERTYLIEELVAALDSADTIMPNAKGLTYDRRAQIGGAFFGTSLSWKRSNQPKRLDGFTDTYFHDDSFRQFISQNVQTDVSLFNKFIREHQNQGFYRVTIWQPGYLMFHMLEGRQTQKGLMFVVVPINKTAFDGAGRLGAKNP